MKLLARIVILVLIMNQVPFIAAQDPGWPREMKSGSARLVYYQPQVDEWSDFKTLNFRMAFTLTPADGKEVVGVMTIRGLTDVDLENRNVFIHDLAIKGTSFPSLDPANAAKMDKLVRTFLPPTHTVTMSVERLVACVPKQQKVTGVPVKNDPPPIFVNYGQSILLQLDGPPVRAAIPNTKLEFVVNTQLPVFLDKAGSKYYLFTGEQWLTAPRLEDTWTLVKSLPKEISKLPEDPQWAALKKGIPPPKSSSSAAPKVVYTTSPSEVIQIKGQPVYVKIPGTKLTYISNTESDLLVYVPTTKYYYLASGRWFSAASLQGPWKFASGELPPDFAQIPPDSPMARVLVSVPGTEEAKDAVLLAQIPTTIEVDPVKAAAQAKVTYSGSPEFKPIQGTSLSYATNTTDKVIKVGDVYYLCLQGLWFMSTTPNGPWTTASSIPKEIYTIPPSSPVYNVTYVTQTTTSSGSVQSSYTAGYMGAFVVGVAVGAIICGGTGYYYPPYYYYPRYGYPIYHPHPPTYGWAAYNPYTGAYGRGVTTYGPYGSASVGRAYNPYTGTYAQGARVSTPYGSAAAGRAYNPYTGTAAATRQASSPYGQWGGSVVAGQNQAVRTQHATNSQGTVARAQSTTGAKAAGISTDYGSAFAAKSSSGDMYAGKDGNVYKNTGDGWQKYDDGSWSSVQPPASGSAQSTRSSAQTQSANATSTQQRSQSAGASASATSTQQRSQAAGASTTASTQQRSQSARTASTSTQQRTQSYSGSASHTQSLNQDMQSRQRGSRYSSQSYGGGRSSGGGGRRAR